MMHEDEFGEEPEIAYYPGWVRALIWLGLFVLAWQFWVWVFAQL
jgi:hypothetical protein